MHTTKNSTFAHIAQKQWYKMTSTTNTYYLGLPSFGKTWYCWKQLRFKLPPFAFFASRRASGRWSHISAIRRRRGVVIYKNSFTLAATLDTDIHHSKHCINLALPTLVPVLNSPSCRAVHTENCEGWWLSSCRGSVAWRCSSAGCPPLQMPPRAVCPSAGCPPGQSALGQSVPRGHSTLGQTVPS